MQGQKFALVGMLFFAGAYANAMPVEGCPSQIKDLVPTSGIQNFENQSETGDSTMKAIGYLKSLPIENPSSLVDIELPAPNPTKRDLLVQVKSISVNPVDAKQRQRSDAGESASHVVLGWDASGVVEAVGPGVTDFAVGDEVFYAGSITRPGANCELHLVDERIVAKKPLSVSFEEAAALPLTALTAYEAIFERLNVEPARDKGKTILIIGGAGGVGSIATQIAKLAGLRVVATASRPQTVEWSGQMGADSIVNHREPLKPQLQRLGIEEVDYIFNTANTAQYWDVMADLIRPAGKIVSIVESSQPLDLTKLMMKSASFGWELMFTRSMFETPDMAKQGEILKAVAEWVDAGKLKSTVTQRFAQINAENLRKAHGLLESGESIGKNRAVKLAIKKGSVTFDVRPRTAEGD